MQLDENTPNSVATRPTIVAAGSLVRWFQTKSPGVTGTTIDRDFLNDILGNFRALFTAAGITRTKGPSGDSDLTNAIHALASWPPYFINGFAMDGPGATWVVNFGVGSARAHTIPGSTVNTIDGSLTAASFTKKLDGSAWAAGTGANGLANGATAKAGDGWYAAFLMIKSSDGSADIGFDSSTVAANLRVDSVVVAAGFDRFRFVGWVQVNAGNTDVEPFFYDPDSGLWQYMNWKQASTVDTDTTITLDLPEGDLDVLMRSLVEAGAVDSGVLLRHTSGSLAASSSTTSSYTNWAATNGSGGGQSTCGAGFGVVRADSSKQVRQDMAGTVTALEAALFGFYVKRSDR